MPSPGLHETQWATFTYKFSEHGGSVGVIRLTGGASDGASLPDNALLVRALLEPIEALDSVDATATVMLGVTGNDNALLGATQFDDAAWVPEASTLISSELPLKLAADCDLIATVGGTVPTITHDTTQEGGVADEEVQTITVEHADGGTMTWTYSGQTTAPIAYGASAATAQAAIDALSNIAPGDIVVTKLANVYTLTAQAGGAFHFTDIDEFTSSATGLTSDNDLTAGEFDVHVEYLPGR